MTTSAVSVREAATVMLVRDAPEFEVFMLRRNPEQVFAGGAYVFPGGAVDDDDLAAASADRASGVGAARADAMLGTDDGLRFWVAALRESFEEAGVLVARSRTSGSLLATTPDKIDELARDRQRLLAGDSSFAAILDAHDARLDLGAVVPFARWITPPGGPRRFDTWFFAAPAPSGHTYEHDDFEMVASEWVRPADALARAHAGEIELIYPTVRSLLVMARYPSAAAFLDAAQERWERADPLRVMDPDLGWQLDVATDDEHHADDLASREVLGSRFNEKALDAMVRS